jgi:maltose O-acetyltransferase
MTVSEREKMAAGEWYTCIDPELERLRARAREAAHEHNTLPPGQRGNMGAALAGLLAGVATDSFVEAPFHCAYGINIFMGAGVYLNAGCTILDSARVAIGRSSMLGPKVQIYCAEHHKDPVQRQAGLRSARRFGSAAAPSSWAACASATAPSSGPEPSSPRTLRPRPRS